MLAPSAKTRSPRSSASRREKLFDRYWPDTGDSSLSHNQSMLDYSQHGQALILRQLITPDTPRILVDIGAHDGMTNSNSRALVEQGWRAVLVEPLPMAFAQLRENCRDFPETTLLLGPRRYRRQPPWNGRRDGPVEFAQIDTLE